MVVDPNNAILINGQWVDKNSQQAQNYLASLSMQSTPRNDPQPAKPVEPAQTPTPAQTTTVKTEQANPYTLSNGKVITDAYKLDDGRIIYEVYDPKASSNNYLIQDSSRVTLSSSDNAVLNKYIANNPDTTSQKITEYVDSVVHPKNSTQTFTENTSGIMVPVGSQWDDTNKTDKTGETKQIEQVASGSTDIILSGNEPVISGNSTLTGKPVKFAIVGANTLVGVSEPDMYMDSERYLQAYDTRGNVIKNAFYDVNEKALNFVGTSEYTGKKYGELPYDAIPSGGTGEETTFEKYVKDYYNAQPQYIVPGSTKTEGTIEKWSTTNDNPSNQPLILTDNKVVTDSTSGESSPVIDLRGSVIDEYFQGVNTGIKWGVDNPKTYESKVKQYESDSTSFKNKYGTLESEISTYNMAINALNTEGSKLKSDLESYNAKVKVYNETGHGDYNTLTAEGKQIDARIAAYNEKSSTTKNTGNTLESKVTAYESDYNKVNTEYSELKKMEDSQANPLGLKFPSLTSFYDDAATNDAARSFGETLHLKDMTRAVDTLNENIAGLNKWYDSNVVEPVSKAVSLPELPLANVRSEVTKGVLVIPEMITGMAGGSINVISALPGVLNEPEKIPRSAGFIAGAVGGTGGQYVIDNPIQAGTQLMVGELLSGGAGFKKVNGITESTVKPIKTILDENPITKSQEKYIDETVSRVNPSAKDVFEKDVVLSEMFTVEETAEGTKITPNAPKTGVEFIENPEYIRQEQAARYDYNETIKNEAYTVMERDGVQTVNPAVDTAYNKYMDDVTRIKEPQYLANDKYDLSGWRDKYDVHTPNDVTSIIDERLSNPKFKSNSLKLPGWAEKAINPKTLSDSKQLKNNKGTISLSREIRESESKNKSGREVEPDLNSFNKLESRDELLKKDWSMLDNYKSEIKVKSRSKDYNKILKTISDNKINVIGKNNIKSLEINDLKNSNLAMTGLKDLTKLKITTSQIEQQATMVTPKETTITKTKVNVFEQSRQAASTVPKISPVVPFAFPSYGYGRQNYGKSKVTSIRSRTYENDIENINPIAGNGLNIEEISLESITGKNKKKSKKRG